MIQRELQNPLATAILEGRVVDDSAVKVTAGEDGLVLAPQPLAAAA